LLDEIPHARLIRGVVIVSARDAGKVIKFLRKLNAEIHVRKVELTPKDKKSFRGRVKLYFVPHPAMGLILNAEKPYSS